jgi:hypothetical protein
MELKNRLKKLPLILFPVMDKAILQCKYTTRIVRYKQPMCYVDWLLEQPVNVTNDIPIAVYIELILLIMSSKPARNT